MYPTMRPPPPSTRANSRSTRFARMRVYVCARESKSTLKQIQASAVGPPHSRIKARIV